MPNSYRIRTQVGVDKSVRVLLEQDFEQLEILSLKILQNQIYTRQCSDYGVIVGRITTNDGFGLPNCKVSVFIPLTSEDERNPVISELYPYKTVSTLNEDGYRYNLLPYVQSHSGHVPTGSFPDREDVLINPALIEVYDKYYKFTTQTNDSGDYMIFGVPVGGQTIHVDIDLSDIGEFSLSPQDLIRVGLATESQVAGLNFKSSSNLNSLPQILSFNKTINIEPFWGEPEICTIGITRTDFDITQEANISIIPTAIFMGSIFSNGDDQFQTRLCRPKLRSGELCNLITNSGEILAIRQTVELDNQGKPILETFDLESGGQVIDDNGTWLVDVPMNLDYVTTNEFGDRVLSNDPKVGIPTKGKYRFKIKWNQSPALSEEIKRGYFLVPNIREYGWQTSNDDPFINPSNPNYDLVIKSYAFSLNWDDYVDVQAAINCDDTFYLMSYNKVYTVSQLIDRYRRGFLPNEFIGIKNNLDESCESDNLKFPNNDANYRFDLLYLLALITSYIFRPILYALIPIIHVLKAALLLLALVLSIIVGIVLYVILPICYVISGIVSFLNALGAGLDPVDCIEPNEIQQIMEDIREFPNKIINIRLPLLVYPNCELCSCEDGGQINDGEYIKDEYVFAATETGGLGKLSTYMLPTQYEINDVDDQFKSSIQSLLSGTAFTRDQPSGKARVPQYTSFGVDKDVCGLFCTNDEPCPKVLFTNNLPIAERLNLFNVKTKYFDESVSNPGGGVNRIKVTFNTDFNNPATHYHLDNMLVISCKEGSLSDFPAGQLITFQDLALSKDININGFTELNQFGTSAVTGETFNNDPNGPQVNVIYADPNGTGSRTVSYKLKQNDDISFHKFPMDVEYFQVITAMTYSSFDNLCTYSERSLNTRFLNCQTILREVNKKYYFSYYSPPPSGLAYPPGRLYNTLQLYKNYEEQVIVFLVRGVDPYSTKQKCQYDLSRLFGYPLNTQGLPEGQVVVNGDFKLNIPIQPGFKSTRHNYGITSTSNILTGVDTVTNNSLYHNSYHFRLSTTGLAKFSGFTSNLPTYYSSLDSSQTNFRPTDATTDIYVGKYAAQDTTTGSLSVIVDPYALIPAAVPAGTPAFDVLSYLNDMYYGFAVEFDSKIITATPLNLNIPNCTRDYFGAKRNDPFPYGQYNTRGYFVGEIIEGGSLMGQKKSRINDLVIDRFFADGWYFSPRYDNTYNFVAANNQSDASKIIMRSDRLPTSTTTTDCQGNSFVLQNNLIFSIFKISDEGLSSGNIGTASFIGGGFDSNAGDLLQQESIPNPVFSSFDCGGSVPLRCYYVDNNEIKIRDDNDECYTNNIDGSKIMKNGCYNLITTVILSLPLDILLLTEWTSRLLVNFGACRNVWSHLFVNNWINGSLYAFAFKNNRVFDSLNQPYSEYCKQTLILHPTNNFYYRSSPYITGTTTGFIGSTPTTFLGIPFGGNEKNLKFPTTLLDLGPRSDYLQELIFSDEFDGYVANRLIDTTYTDTSDILNFLIISRLTNQNFIEILMGAAGGTIFLFFLNKRELFKNLVDADYAQMISISSELGINAFEPINYQQNSIYINSPNVDDVVIGIFWSSNTQIREYITPKRTLINSNVNPSSTCAFLNIPVFSQEVPFYQWQIKDNEPSIIGGSANSIFGSESNNWYTKTINVNGTFFSSKYQSMDRINQNSRYFRYGQGNNINGKGYIFAEDSNGNSSDRNLWAHNNPDLNTVTVGAPFHFYFGLKKGKTSFDRFSKKWINFNNITQ